MAFDRLILLAAATALAAPASAQMVSAKRPETVVAFLQEKGFRAELSEGEDGPQIKSGAGGTPFTIFFRNCEKKLNCTTVSFFSGYTDLDNVPLAKINGWNQNNRFARAYIDSENDPVLIMDVDLDHDGIPKANFGEYLDIFSGLAPKYLNYLRGDD